MTDSPIAKTWKTPELVLLEGVLVDVRNLNSAASDAAVLSSAS